METKEYFDQITAAFNEYKKANEERLVSLEKGESGAEAKEKIERIEAKLTELENAKGELEAKFSRPVKSEDRQMAAELEHKSAFETYLRRGDESKINGLSEEVKAMNTITGEDGGYAVPRQMAAGILKMLDENNPMRGAVSVISVSTEDYTQLVDTGTATSGWVGETSPRPETLAGGLKSISPVFGEIYAFPFATQRALDDISFNVESYISNKIAMDFAVKENAAFTNGDGVRKPKGLFAYDFVASGDDTRDYGKFQFIKSGAASTLGTNPADKLIELQDSLRGGYQGSAVWMMNAATLTSIRQLKDSQGNYIWAPGISTTTPNSIFGKPYILNHDMPVVGAGALAVAYGDFKRAYTIVDRVGIRMTRDPYTNKPFVGFYATKRVGSMALDTQAVKAIKISA